VNALHGAGGFVVGESAPMDIVVVVLHAEESRGARPAVAALFPIRRSPVRTFARTFACFCPLDDIARPSFVLTPVSPRRNEHSSRRVIESWHSTPASTSSIRQRARTC